LIKKSRFALPVAFALAFAVFASSCLSSPEPEAKSGSRAEGIAQELKTLKLAPGEIWVRELGNSESSRSATAFSASNAMLDLDNWFDFQSTLKDEQTQALAERLYKDLPELDAPGDLRVVAVGGVYPGDSPLIVVISQFSLKEGIVPGRKWGIQYMTNSAKYRSQDKKTGKLSLMSMGTYLESSICLSRLVVPMDNGDFTLASDLDLGKTKMEALKDDVERANAMDTFIKDESAENDSQVAVLRDAVAKSGAAPAEAKLLAEMNWGLFLLKSGKADEAEALWKSLVPQVPAGADPSLMNAITQDTAFQLKIFRAWR
jgi:hypothetical protein